MTLISYAQNYEDVMLWRALKHIKNGFYIDVGAWSPDIDSVTRFFYEQGWRGINIEPNPMFLAQLEERRPQDNNLQVAVSDSEGTLTMNFLDNPGLSTLDDNIAEKHQQTGRHIDRQEVAITTLATICKEHVPGSQDVHFLKVDVEGLEAAVLLGNDWNKYRPWIVIVEATLPMSQIESHNEWEHILLTADYQFAYADGLNRFYVEQGHSELLLAFKYPPNVFDAFKLAGQQEAEINVMQAETRAIQFEGFAKQAEARANQAEATVNALMTSVSWRITAPCRWVTTIIRQSKSMVCQWRFKVILQFIALYIIRRPKLKRGALLVLNHFPALKTRLLRVIMGSLVGVSMSAKHSSIKLDQLTPHARQIYNQLKAAIKNNKKRAK